MKRRGLVAGAAATAGAGLSARLALGQDRPKMLRVGYVSIVNQRASLPFSAVEGRLRELGYAEGQNFAVDYVNLDGRIERAGDAMKAVIARKPDVLVAFTEAVLSEAVASKSALPIVMAAIDFDPLARGYVKSLARPGSNVTGVYMQQIELAEKRMQLLKEAFPDLHAVTMFWDGPSAQQWQASQKAARTLGLDLVGVEFTAPPYEYDVGLAKAPASHRQMLSVCNSPLFFRDRLSLAEFALRNRAASMFAWREWVEAGGLISYGPGFTEIARRAADYVDRIARGANPADLPVEQPTKFELVINMKTANALGLTIPPSILARADEVIE